MTPVKKILRFEAKLLCPAKPDRASPWAFVILPRHVSEKLPRRGRTTVEGSINAHPVQVTLEPDGQLSHWLPISRALQEAIGLDDGDTVALELSPVDKEPEPDIPPDFLKALAVAPEAQSVWMGTTTIARVDWIHWIVSAKQAKTRAKRIADACEMLACGKRRVCCFDPSGYYSKALGAPEAVEFSVAAKRRNA